MTVLRGEWRRPRWRAQAIALELLASRDLLNLAPARLVIDVMQARGVSCEIARYAVAMARRNAGETRDVRWAIRREPEGIAA